MYNTHHTIPISLSGTDLGANKIRLDTGDHKRLHEEQDMKYNIIRRWREKVNHIILPNEFTESERLRVLQAYFDRIGNNPQEVVIAQLQSLYAQQSNDTISRSYHNPKEKAHELLESQTQDRLRIILSPSVSPTSLLRNT